MSQLHDAVQLGSGLGADNTPVNISDEEQQQKQQTYYEWLRNGYQKQYENWKPWLEDQYLRWITKDNKASYATKGALKEKKHTRVFEREALCRWSFTSSPWKRRKSPLLLIPSQPLPCETFH